MITSSASFNLETIRNNIAPSTKASKAYLNAFLSSIRHEMTKHAAAILSMEGNDLRGVVSLGSFYRDQT